MGSFLQGQQLPIFTQNQEAYSLLNPASVSSNYLKYGATMTTNAMYRYQWVGIEGAPRTMMLNHEFFSEDNNFLLGANITHDQTGPTGFIGLNARFAYLIQLNRDNFISAGVSGGVVQYSVKGDELNFAEQDEVESAGLNVFRPDFSFGAMWYYVPRRGNRYYFGVSVPQVFGFNLNFRNDNDAFDIQRVRHYYALAGAQFAVGDGSWLELDAWAKYVEFVPFHADLNLRYEHENSFWVGIGASTAGASHAEAGLIATLDGGDLRIGYGYNHFFTTYGPAFGDAHELKVAYVWGY